MKLKALWILKEAGIYQPRFSKICYHGFSGGDHHFMIDGYYYAVDLVLGTWRQTA